MTRNKEIKGQISLSKIQMKGKYYSYHPEKFLSEMFSAMSDFAFNIPLLYHSHGVSRCNTSKFLIKC